MGTVTMYGDQWRDAVVDALSKSSPLLPEHITLIVDFAVPRQTDSSNFEGSGYNYSPITAEEGPPNLLQVFEITHGNFPGYGIKTTFDTYLRSQHWERKVGQSPHCLGDERWTFEEFGRRPKSKAAKSSVNKSNGRRPKSKAAKSSVN